MEVNYKELVYIPAGADKGDCPYCSTGVLARDQEVEQSEQVREGYICDTCGRHFIKAVVAYRGQCDCDSRHFVNVSDTVLAMVV